MIVLHDHSFLPNAHSILIDFQLVEDQSVFRKHSRGTMQITEADFMQNNLQTVFTHYELNPF